MLCSVKGRRVYQVSDMDTSKKLDFSIQFFVFQEDRYNICALKPNLLLLAVWDGHGGDACSKFCAQHVEKFFFHRLELEERDSGKDEKFDLEKIVKMTLFDLDEAFARHWQAQHRNSRPDKPTPGTTATVAVVRDG